MQNNHQPLSGVWFWRIISSFERTRLFLKYPQYLVKLSPEEPLEIDEVWKAEGYPSRELALHWWKNLPEQRQREHAQWYKPEWSFELVSASFSTIERIFQKEHSETFNLVDNFVHSNNKMSRITNEQKAKMDDLEDDVYNRYSDNLSDDEEIEELEKDLWKQITGTPPVKTSDDLLQELEKLREEKYTKEDWYKANKQLIEDHEKAQNKVNELRALNLELLGALQNFMGATNTPVRRRLFPNKFIEECIEYAEPIIEKCSK